jgi:cell division protein YceG involved in septum cleavage
MSYEVGDIVWVVGYERPGLRVFRVVEEVTKKTLQGTITSYRLQPPLPVEKSKLVPMENIEGTFFTDKSSVRKELLENASSAIDRMIEKSQNMINKHWSEKPPPQISDEFINNDKPIDPKESIVELPDGTKAILRTNIEDIT